MHQTEVEKRNMTDIQVISFASVQASHHKESTRIELTPWDLQLLLVGPIQKGLLFKKPPWRQQNNMISCLKSSLSRTLEIFTPFAGRLATDVHEGGKVSYYIDCNNTGALFVHAAANGVTIDDVLDPIYVPNIVHSFFPLNGVHNYEGTSKPLLAVKVTELVDGVFLGCSVNHVVADGKSFWHFVNIWSEICRGSDYKIKPPALKRWFLDGVEHPVCISLPSDKKLLNDKNCVPSGLKERVFHFTRQSIAQLKAKANTEMGTDKISSLQAMSAHLWRSVVRNQNLDPNQDVHYRFLIGARQRLHPKMTEQYFGNAVQAGTVTMKAGELLDHGLGYAAMEMNKMIAMHTEDKLKSFLESWVENPKLLTVGGMASHALVTSSSPRFDVYGNDFGWGKPLAVRSGLGNKHEGKITLFSGVEDGSVDIEVCLLLETLEALGHDAEFMDAIN